MGESHNFTDIKGLEPSDKSKKAPIMSETLLAAAQREIDESLILTTFSMNRIGLSFVDPKTPTAYLLQKFTFVVSLLTILYHVFSEIAYIGIALANSPRVEDVVPMFHTFGYGLLSIAKVFVLWYKKDVFKKLIEELSGIWPVPPLDEEAQVLKTKSLDALRLAHRSYFAVNVIGVWFYNLTPFAIYFYKLFQGQEASIGFVWVSWYPFDKYEPVYHVFTYIFEVFAGQTCVWIMISTDLLFAALASHVSLLLKLLQKRLETLAANPRRTDEENYEEILGNIKLHQRLIRYCNDLEDGFSVSNFVNIILSSANICCVMFVIVLLEPVFSMSNKLFLGSALIQVGLICWYGDDILHANGDVADSAYNSGWYLTGPKCRRALLFLIIRAQKPIGFTAMKFTTISLVTYSSILTRSYSYFALLYTMYTN